MTEDLIAKLALHVEDSDSVHVQLIEHDRSISERLDYLIEELLGKPRVNIDGQVIRSDGRMDQMENRLSNLETKVPIAKILTLSGAMAASVASIVVAIVG